MKFKKISDQRKHTRFKSNIDDNAVEVGIIKAPPKQRVMDLEELLRLFVVDTQEKGADYSRSQQEIIAVGDKDDPR